MVGRELGANVSPYCDAARRNAFVRDSDPARRRFRGCEPRCSPRRDRRARRSCRPRELRSRTQPCWPASAGRGRNPDGRKTDQVALPSRRAGKRHRLSRGRPRRHDPPGAHGAREPCARRSRNVVPHGVRRCAARGGRSRPADQGALGALPFVDRACRVAQRRQPAEARARPLARRRSSGSLSFSIRPQASMSARAPRSTSISAISPTAAGAC